MLSILLFWVRQSRYKNMKEMQWELSNISQRHIVCQMFHFIQCVWYLSVLYYFQAYAAERRVNDYFHWYNKHWKESFLAPFLFHCVSKNTITIISFVRFKFDGHLNKEKCLLLWHVLLYHSYLQKRMFLIQQ